MSDTQKKKMLIYAHYYAPDVASTGQILQDMAEGMRGEFDTTVICTVPSYTGHIDERYREKRVYREEINGVHVMRVPVPEFSKANKKSRIVNLLCYLWQARRATRLAGQQDYVFTISQPPILGGMLGVYGKAKLRAQNGRRPKLIYCIQDFNPEQTRAVSYIRNGAVLGVMQYLDNRTCRRSDLVVTVGRDLVETLESRFASKRVPKHVMINNWIDEEAIHPLPANHPEIVAFRRRYGLDGRFVFMYSGNVGLYYDLEGLIRVMEKFRDAETPDGRKVAFAIVGAGSVLDKLEQYQRERNLENVVFIPYQDKDRLIYSLNAADVHLCVNARGIKGVSCPSKFYGICGVEKPVLGVLEEGSEVQMLIDEIGCGRCSEPGDYAKIEQDIKWFISRAGSGELEEMGQRGHDYLMANLTRDISIGKYIEAIKGL